MNLVIVESPAKCKKLNSFLGSNYKVVASMGHFRDLPAKSMGINLDTMQPDYVILKPDVVERLQRDAAKCDTIYLCTDPDREGEAISWHLRHVLPKEKTYLRSTFQEISKKAVLAAIQNSGDINLNMAYAQQARRLLDRLVGYKLSPELWRVFPGKKSLSAGRVQSVATRLIVEREREIENFQDEVYFKLYSHHNKENKKFRAEFKGVLENEKFKELKLKEEDDVKNRIKTLETSEFVVSEVKEKEQKLKPQPPFTTSNMQAKAANVLKLSANKSMQLAQKLYEEGHITYHRTDSFAISKDAVDFVRNLIKENYGEEYCPKAPMVYSNKASSQEAHECIRPVKIDVEKPPGLSGEMLSLYQLIYRQFVSCQMECGRDAVTTVFIDAADHRFEARGRVELFDGFRRINREEVQEKSRKKKEEEDSEKQKLPALQKGEILKLDKLESKKLKTKPPPRYTEAGLIKKLEREGIGRPSTYASIVSTIVNRGYVSLKSRKYHAEKLGMQVTDYLVGRFPDVLNVEFTKSCEGKLDTIGDGKLAWDAFLKEFWDGLKIQLYKRGRMQISPPQIDLHCPKCKKVTEIEESKKWKSRYFYCCHACRCYLEADKSGKPKVPAKWLVPEN